MDLKNGVIFLFFTIAFLAVSFFQFREKGLLLNNAYLWASEKEREEMNRNPEKKRPHYRQSGAVFLLLGISFASYSLYCFLSRYCLLVAFWAMLAAAVLYAVVSSVRSQLRP